MILALVCFAVFSVSDLGLSLIRDLPIPDDLPLLGRHGLLQDVTRKALGAGWACSLAFIFYLLIRLLADQAATLRRTIAELEHGARVARDSERQLRLVTDNIPAYIAYIDAHERIRFVNKRNQEFKGLPLEEIVGQPLREIVGATRYASIKPHVDTVLSGQAVTFERTHDYEQHGTRTITCSFIPDLDDAGEVVGYYSVTIDVTDLRGSERQLQRFREELVHAGRLSTMGEMAAGMAHELNQPLAAIASYCFVARQTLERRGEDDDALISLLGKLEEQALRAGRIIERLRALTRKTASQRVEVGINRLIREVVELAESELRQQEIQLHLDLDENLPEVLVDVVQIQQVLLNLVQNAIDAMLETERSRRRLEIRAYRSECNRVEVVVSDTGQGVSSEEETQLFTPFYTTKSNGTGMGLAISRSIIETHDGRIWLKRNAERGVAVCFTLAVGSEACSMT
jgi:PAS domain S-box-containing protein